jgi:formamidopyrimidine-DNA glycosylase
MPELPEVETTRRGLQKEIVGLRILAVWTDLKTSDKRKKDTVADPKYFRIFKREIVGKRILSVERRAKNILINLSNKKTILIHLKLTGYLFVGGDGERGLPKYIHLFFSLSKNKFVALSDLRKFAKITLLAIQETRSSKHLGSLGPEPLAKNFTLKRFRERILKKPKGKIKTVLMDQSVLAGLGNIYSDEILWAAGIQPERIVAKIREAEFKKMFQAMKKILRKAIHLGGDSTSDYLNIHGRPGKFQLHHKAYQRTGEKCRKPGCKGVIMRKIINGRSAHFCPRHQF